MTNVHKRTTAARHLGVVAVAVAIYAIPAWPCTILITNDTHLHPDVTGDAPLPTNVQLYVTPPILGVRGLLTDDDGTVIDLAEVGGEMGRVELSPNTRYTWTDSSAQRAEADGSITFRTGPGPTNDAPRATSIGDVEAEHVPATGGFIDEILYGSCASTNPAHTRFHLHADDADDVIAIVTSEGTVGPFGRGTVSVSDREGVLANTDIDVVVIDITGQRSAVTTVTLPGAAWGCAQSTPATVMPLSLLAAALLLARRRR